MLKCHAVTERIMSCFATGLGLNEDFFKEVSYMACIQSTCKCSVITPFTLLTHSPFLAGIACIRVCQRYSDLHSSAQDPMQQFQVLGSC